MGHNIGQMFYVGKRPWHRLGKLLPQLATLDEAIRNGGLDYKVALAPLALDGEPESAVPQRMAVVRTDRKPGEAGRVLGVVHPNFKLLQNRDGGEMFDVLFGRGQRVYETGGYLKQGEIVWLQAKLPEPITVADNDKLDAYLLFSNSHDGTYAIDIRITTVRVVCNNTLNIALEGRSRAAVFRRGHNDSLNKLASSAEDFFAEVVDAQRAAQDRMRKLASAACDDAAFKAFVEKLLPLPAAPAGAAAGSTVALAHETRCANIKASREGVKHVFDQGHDVPMDPTFHLGPAEKTWWGALNSFTAWVDHCQEVNGDRFAHAMFGSGSALKTTAYASALERIGVKATDPIEAGRA